MLRYGTGHRSCGSDAICRADSGAADAIEHIVVKDFTKCLVIRMRSVPALDFRPNISAALNRVEEIITIS